MKQINIQQIRKGTKIHDMSFETDFLYNDARKIALNGQDKGDILDIVKIQVKERYEVVEHSDYVAIIGVPCDRSSALADAIFEQITAYVGAGDWFAGGGAGSFYKYGEDKK